MAESDEGSLTLSQQLEAAEWREERLLQRLSRDEIFERLLSEAHDKTAVLEAEQRKMLIQAGEEKARHAVLLDERNALKAEVEELQGRLSQSLETLAEQRAEAAALRARVTIAEDRSKELHDQHTALEAERNAAREQLSSLQLELRQMTRLQQQLDQLHAEKAELAQRIAVSDARGAAAELERDAAIADRRRTTEGEREAQAAREFACEQLAAAQATMARLEERLSSAVRTQKSVEEKSRESEARAVLGEQRWAIATQERDKALCAEANAKQQLAVSEAQKQAGQELARWAEAQLSAARNETALVLERARASEAQRDASEATREQLEERSSRALRELAESQAERRRLEVQARQLKDRLSTKKRVEMLENRDAWQS